MTERRYSVVDVFTSTALKGNPVAVCFNADDLDAQTMLAIAAWTNLSETTFVQSPTHPEADYRLRIFTPRSELPFAGHPTVGSAWALLESGLKPKTPGRLVQECGAGLVHVRKQGDELLLRLPKPKMTELSAGDRDFIVGALGISPESVLCGAVVNVGPVWITVQQRQRKCRGDRSRTEAFAVNRVHRKARPLCGPRRHDPRDL